MKGRASGMQDEACWASFFQPEGILDRLPVTQGAATSWSSSAVAMARPAFRQQSARAAWYKHWISTL